MATVTLLESQDTLDVILGDEPLEIEFDEPRRPVVQAAAIVAVLTGLIAVMTAVARRQRS